MNGGAAYAVDHQVPPAPMETDLLGEGGGGGGAPPGGADGCHFPYNELCPVLKKHVTPFFFILKPGDLLDDLFSGPPAPGPPQPTTTPASDLANLTGF